MNGIDNPLGHQIVDGSLEVGVTELGDVFRPDVGSEVADPFLQCGQPIFALQYPWQEDNCGFQCADDDVDDAGLTSAVLMGGCEFLAPHFSSLGLSSFFSHL